MEVFSRSGLKVYGFSGEGERLKEWTGWDGNINKSSIKASPGVYYYIIRALDGTILNMTARNTGDSFICTGKGSKVTPQPPEGGLNPSHKITH